MQKFSQGKVVNFASCDMRGTMNCRFTGVTEKTSQHLVMLWDVGLTEGGSSGSGLLCNIGGREYLVGVLSGGNSTCSNLQTQDYYGRLDQAWKDGNLAQWLRPQ